MNLKLLAEQLGLSQTTVSRALNGYPEVSENTRERVMAAANAAGYYPNAAARGLAMGKNEAIGIVYPLSPNDLGNPFFLDVVAGMSATLEAAGKELIIASASPADELRAYQRLVKGRRVDGLIVARTRRQDERIAYLQSEGMPFVAHGRTELDIPYAWFDYDNHAGMTLAVRRLLDLGHRRIGLISSSLAMTFAHQRHAGYIDTLRAAGIPPDATLCRQNVSGRLDGYQAMSELLALPQPPTAVVVDSNTSAIGAVRAVLDAGLQLGRDLSMITYDQLPADSLLTQPMTAVINPQPQQAGAKLIELMLALLAGAAPETLRHCTAPQLQVGNSDGPCPQ